MLTFDPSYTIHSLSLVPRPLGLGTRLTFTHNMNLSINWFCIYHLLILHILDLPTYYLPLCSVLETRVVSHPEVTCLVPRLLVGPTHREPGYEATCMQSTVASPQPSFLLHLICCKWQKTGCVPVKEALQLSNNLYDEHKKVMS